MATERPAAEGRGPAARGRGRPPHPDVLTPAEWRVLELLREGLSNPEIAERLGLSRDTVKTHVGAILSKLGVSTAVVRRAHSKACLRFGCWTDLINHSM